MSKSRVSCVDTPYRLRYDHGVMDQSIAPDAQCLWFRFYAELNDFLPRHRRHRRFAVPYPGRTSIKDAIEARGVPHPEVALVLVHGMPVDFRYVVQPGDQIEVYSDRAAAAMPWPPLRPPPPPQLVLDTHLGRLADRLRLLGFDALYRNDWDDVTLARIAGDEERLLLTRDLGLLKRSIVRYGYFVRATDPDQQVIEILRRFDWFDAIAPFRRCIRCNGLLTPVAKADIVDQLLPQTRAEQSEFQRCKACGRIYWPGSHVARMQQFVEQVRQAQHHRARDEDA